MPEIESLDVLVIEDDADTRANLADILELDQHRVHTAASMSEAFETADWASVNIVLLDRKLPDGDASELLPKLHERAPDAEVIIVTGYRDLEGALECLHQGAADYLLKPINPEALRANLRRVAKARQVSEQLRLLATAVREVKEGILITDGDLERPGPRIVFVNEAMTDITGYAAEELVGKSPRIFQSPHTDRRVLQQLKQQLLEAKPFTGELINRKKDGREYFVELHVSPVVSPAGRVVNFVATQRDITARKQAEERVLQAERLAAIGQMVTGLAHESRNALQRSKACLEMLATEVEDRPEALDLVMRVSRAQDHLHHLYEEVRSYAAPINLQRATVDVADVWREMWADLENLREGRDVLLREEIDGVDTNIEVDPFAIGQVFRNVFENALVACGIPCEIVVSCMPVCLDNKPALQFSVVDNGPGLNAEQAQRIFEPFYTTKTKGTGLGMAISKRIVEAHGGRISVSTKRKRGAEIVITLPRQRPLMATRHMISADDL